MKKRILSLTLIMAMVFTQVSALTVFAEEQLVEEQPVIKELQKNIITLRPIDATYVSQYGDDANTNFHDSGVMKINYTNSEGLTNAWGQYGYMKFDLGDVDRNGITSAKLRLYVSGGDTRKSTRTIGIFDTYDSEWNGSGITWKSGKSSAKSELGSFTVSSDGSQITDLGWREIDITEFLKSGIDNYISLMAKMTSEAAYPVEITSGTYLDDPYDFDENVYEVNMPQIVIESNKNQPNPYHTVQLPAIRDTYVDQNGDDAVKSFADNEYLKVNYTNDENVTHFFGSYSYLDFDISNIEREKTSSAQLWIYVDNESDTRLSTRTIDIFKPASEWQTSMSWTNGRVAPEGDAIASFTVSGNGYNVVDAGWRCIDLTDYLKNLSSDNISLMLKEEGENSHPILIRSNEHINESTRPHLIIKTSDPIEDKFTDSNFLNEIRELIGKTKNEHIYACDVENITELDLTDKSIVDLAGIEYFKELKELVCMFNLFTTLDLSYNRKLEVLDCAYNADLTSINVSNNTELKTLTCEYSSLTNLDIRKNINLVSLSCYCNPIGTLDISCNKLLEELSAYNTGLPYLDVTNNNNLEFLDCSLNQMSSETDIHGLNNTKVKENDGGLEFLPQNIGEDISSFFIDENFLNFVRKKIGKPSGEIYLSDLDKITELDIIGEEITSLDGIEYFRALKKLNIACNFLKTLDLSSNINLSEVNCSNNFIENINVSQNEKLNNLYAVDNYLTELEVSRNMSLSDINVSDNLLTNLNLSNNAALAVLDCSDNYLPGRYAVSLSPKSKSDDDSFTLYSVDDDPLKPQYWGKVLVTFGLQERALRPDPTLKIKDINLANNNQIYVDALTGASTKYKIFDITNIDPSDVDSIIDIPEEQTITQAKNPKEIGFILGLPEKKYEIGSGTTLKNSLNGHFAYTNDAPQRKIVVVVYGEEAGTNSDTGRPIYKGVSAYLKKLDITQPYVKSFTFNSQRDIKTFDLLKIEIPLIYMKGTSTFAVTIGNSSDIEDVYIHIYRPGKDNISSSSYKKREVTIKLKRSTYDSEKFIYSSNELSGGDGLLSSQYTPQHPQYAYLTVQYVKKDSIDEVKQTLYEKKVIYVQDPSGYIYEAVPSNRLADVKTTLYYMEKNGDMVEWNAEEYNQSNPMFTTTEGNYEWFVPIGVWQVKAELPDYETYYTNKMSVPPERTDVNFGMVSTKSPSVVNVFPYPDGIEIEFSKYMCVEDMTEDNIVVSINGEQVPGKVTFINAEYDLWEGIYDTNISGGTGNRYVSKIAFMPEEDLVIGDDIEISINGSVRSYADVTMDQTYKKHMTVGMRPTDMELNNADSNHSMSADGNGYQINYGETESFEIIILPVDVSRGKKLFLSASCPWATEIPEEVVVDENGVATIPIKGLLPGKSTIKMLLEDSNLEQEIDIDVIF